MSHEIRTPLNSVLALTQLLREGVAGPLTVDQRKYLQVIERNGQTLLHLINDILDLSRIEAGHLEMDIQDVDLAPHIAAVVGRWRRWRRPRTWISRSSCPTALPRAAATPIGSGRS